MAVTSSNASSQPMSVCVCVCVRERERERERDSEREREREKEREREILSVCYVFNTDKLQTTSVPFISRACDRHRHTLNFSEHQHGHPIITLIHTTVCIEVNLIVAMSPKA